jgi:16S rRNA processing protein RimM
MLAMAQYTPAGKPVQATTDRKVLVGAVAGPHGVQGEVKIKTFTTDPAAIGRYGPLDDESGTRQYTLKVRGEVRGLVIARMSGVADRNAAEALKGLRLYVSRDRLPKPKKDEWYLTDLVGLRVERADGVAMGRVKSMQNFGAGDLVEVETANGQTVFLPFTKKVFPEVDVAGGRLIVDPPEEVEWKPDGDHDDEGK